MAQVSFTRNLKVHLPCPEVEVSGDTVREILEGVFDKNPKLRGYILEDQGALRKHMNIFINGDAIKDRVTLSDDVPEGAEVYVMQALSGG